MADYTIAETYTLPSKGKVYSTKVVPTFKIRSMTTAEEMRRLTPSDLPYKNMCDVIDACIVDGIGVSSYDLCVADYQFLLHRLRVVTYGPDYKMSNICPYCGCENVSNVNLDELEIKECPDDLEDYMEFDLPVTKKHVKIKMQTPRMADEIATRIKEVKRKSGNDAPDPTIGLTLEMLIEEIDGKRPNPLDIPSWINKLPMKDTSTIIAHAEKLTQAFGVNMEIHEECKVCGLPYQTMFHNTQEFFRPSIDI